MLTFPAIRRLVTLTLASQLAATVAFAQDSVIDERQVSSNRNTEATESGLPVSDLPSTSTAPYLPPEKPILIPAPSVYPFRIQSPDARRPLEIRSMYDVPIARCLGTCVLSLPESKYKVVFLDAERHVQDLEFAVEGSGGIELRDADETTASVGLALGIIGPLSVLTGLVLTARGLDCLMNDGHARNQSELCGMYLGGMGALVAGAAMTPIGWVMYGRNRRARVRELPPTLSIAAAPSRSGAVLGLTGQF